jgi:hypothetical protein
MAGQYQTGNATGNGGADDHEHGYEWQQAREQERLERESAHAAAPPAYDPTSKLIHRTAVLLKLI